jgi:hypothetical protein
MISRRSKRYCPAARKRSYRTYGEALAELDFRRDAITGIAWLSTSAYTCESCDGFHISRKKFTLVKPKGRGKRRRGVVDRIA